MELTGLIGSCLPKRTQLAKFSFFLTTKYICVKDTAIRMSRGLRGTHFYGTIVFNTITHHRQAASDTKPVEEDERQKKSFIFCLILKTTVAIFYSSQESSKSEQKGKGDRCICPYAHVHAHL